MHYAERTPHPPYRLRRVVLCIVLIVFSCEESENSRVIDGVPCTFRSGLTRIALSALILSLSLAFSRVIFLIRSLSGSLSGSLDSLHYVK